jgi:hypothetical protein
VLHTLVQKVPQEVVGGKVGAVVVGALVGSRVGVRVGELVGVRDGRVVGLLVVGPPMKEGAFVVGVLS